MAAALGPDLYLPSPHADMAWDWRGHHQKYQVALIELVDTLREVVDKCFEINKSLKTGSWHNATG
jgi:hypothetical protein